MTETEAAVPVTGAAATDRWSALPGRLSKLADIAPRFAEHFIHAEIKDFGYDELDDAIAWAAGSTTERSSLAAVGTSPNDPQ